ncbi:MAG TPA: MarR family transcriptional regulator [Solirubrobacterales bacterium]|nr:MarR family transcriptional regulator [Solirubrobacterales bacterium]
MQQVTEKTLASPAVVALARLIGAHAHLTRELSAQLVEQHGLTISEYEVLLLLSRAPERAMRRVDLSREVRLSPSGVTRMLDRLEATGIVEKRACESDGRVSYAVLTDAGMAKLEESAPDHIAGVERLLGERLGPDELESLSGVLGRLSAAEGAECTPHG